MVYTTPTPLQQQFFLLLGLKTFIVFCSKELQKFRISWVPSVLEKKLISFLEEGRLCHFCSIGPSIIKHVNSRIIEDKFVYANFSHFYLGIFNWKLANSNSQKKKSTLSLKVLLLFHIKLFG